MVKAGQDSAASTGQIPDLRALVEGLLALAMFSAVILVGTAITCGALLKLAR